MQNFGIINESFKDILAEGISSLDDKSKRIFSRYFKALKENKIFKSQYQIYYNLENKVCEDKLKNLDYIKESISLLKELGVNQIIKENSKLVKLLTKNGYELTDNDYTFKNLHENIGILVGTKKTSSNLNSLMESVYFINDFITNNKVIIKEDLEKDFFPNKAVGHIMIEKFNEKYGHLSESEKKIIRAMINKNSTDKVETYNDIIKECINLVNTSLNECTIDEKDKLLQVKDKLLRMEYNENEFVSEMVKIIKLKSKLV